MADGAGHGLDLIGISHDYGNRRAVDGISFSLPVGGMSILFGASGSGKSTILKLILGLFRPDSGTILVNNQRVDTMRNGGRTKLHGSREHDR